MTQFETIQNKGMSATIERDQHGRWSAIVKRLFESAFRTPFFATKELLKRYLAGTLGL